ncbi:MAG TPA: alpha-glucuronidase family glycosyl hydrolase [bacterium]|nr:alpha-glucuronidase family glycosyl hydrolase [bacterium]HQI49702.1 alpha-glucuronidase family glycosyl hydrolase [bacterium]HQJ66406.1 alpha-glucuronidase family glycosyl hydrolase [bacterium]
MRRIRTILMLALMAAAARAEDGYRLWLRYDPITDAAALTGYRKAITGWRVEGDSPLLRSAADELAAGLGGLLACPMPEAGGALLNGTVVAGTPSGSLVIASLKWESALAGLGAEGYLIRTTPCQGKKIIAIAANSDRGVLYGVFHLLRLVQTRQKIVRLAIRSTPKVQIRILNHWDNLDRTVERGYAGRSLWEWDALPDSLNPRYVDYARANASIGINATVLTNVNANARVLTPEYLRKVQALADVFRPWGIRVFLTARFSAPVEIGGLATADPLDPAVIAWWRAKAAEIYSLIPDFGGFLVKANSEGQPGPQNYGRSHAEGANLLADAVAPFGGIVMWRAFVYDQHVPDDRAKQAWNEFVPLDGQFRANVLIQVKNGPIDFQPREPFHPLFGAMPRTALLPEFQITQEYLGASVHLVYLAPLYEECLQSDTEAAGPGSTVARIIDGSLYPRPHTAMAGVANIGDVRSWTGHPFGQANWYAFGRLSWDPDLDAGTIAGEWVRMTFTQDRSAADRIVKMMLASRETAVHYMTPLGLHHIMYYGHHYGPGPWVDSGRPDWTSVYYHRADSNGLGFDRTAKGSNAVAQYSPPVRDRFENVATCPENLLLWFHHVPWTYRMRSGRSLWEELCRYYDDGLHAVGGMRREWQTLQGVIDAERFRKVQDLLVLQERDAGIWRDGCLLYFQTFAKRPFPAGFIPPAHDLEYYKAHRYTDIPGIP